MFHISMNASQFTKQFLGDDVDQMGCEWVDTWKGLSWHWCCWPPCKIIIKNLSKISPAKLSSKNLSKSYKTYQNQLCKIIIKTWMFVATYRLLTWCNGGGWCKAANGTFVGSSRQDEPPFALVCWTACFITLFRSEQSWWHEDKNKLASWVGAIAISEIWNYDPLTHPLTGVSAS